MWKPALVSLALLTPGCYLSHERARTDSGAALDAGLRPDAGAPRDAGSDAEHPLPDDPPLDPGPDARPGDDVDGGWGMPPRPTPEEPCCRPVTGAVEIPVGEFAAGGVDVEWNGEGWGAAYTSIERGVVFQALRADATPVGPLRQLAAEGTMGVSLTYRGERFAIVRSREGDGRQPSAIALLDRRGVLAAGWTPLGVTLGASTTHVAHLDRWLVATSGPRLFAIDRSAHVVADATVTGGDGMSERPQLVGLKSRAVLFFQEVEAIYASVVDPTLGYEPARAVLSRTDDSFGLNRATRLRDEAIAIVIERDVSAWLVAVDPFSGATERVSAPLAIATGTLAGDALGIDEHGVLAVCSMAQHDDGDTVELHVVDRGGQRVGAQVTVEAAPSGYPRRCALGWSGDTLFVAWTNPHDRVVRARGYALAATP